MIKHIYTEDGMKHLRVEEDSPVCNQDFCDTCGDCLYCYGEQECVDGSEHYWVQYGEKKNENGK